MIGKEGEMKKVYKASHDGFDCAKFHAKLDGTLGYAVIALLEGGAVVGGYTDTLITSADEVYIDNNAFIFRIDDEGDRKYMSFGGSGSVS